MTIEETNIIQNESFVRGTEVLTMKDTNIIQSGILVGREVLTVKETNIIQSRSLVGGGKC